MKSNPLPPQRLLQPKVIILKRIGDKAEHNALTDLIYYRNKFYCVFREADIHAEGKDGKIRILSSSNAIDWESIALLNKEGIDLRDPQLSEMPDGRLMLSMGGSVYKEGKYLGCSPHVSFSENGKDWSEVHDLKIKNEWIWRVTWHNGVGYGASYSLSDPKDRSKPWHLKLFRTTDGLKYTLLKEMEVPEYPSETTLRFKEDGTMVALVRRRKNAWIGIAKPPYLDWHWSDSGSHFGGPNFLILPNGEMWAGGRIYVNEGDDERPKTVLAWMTLSELIPVVMFPSGGDTSYPGMVFREGKLYMSYYSSHEGKAMIYVAVVE